jgi:hypothetical protein
MSDVRITSPCTLNGIETELNPGAVDNKIGLVTSGGSAGYVEASFINIEETSCVSRTIIFKLSTAILSKIKIPEDRESSHTSGIGYTMFLS